MGNPTVIINPEGNEFSGANPNFADLNSTNNGTGTIISDGNSATIRNNTSSDQRKIVGFVVSYSKTHVGESWPLYLGRNNIGGNADADIPLFEKRVSQNHAFINVRRAFNPNTEREELLYIISDNGSTNGVKVGGVDIYFSTNGNNNQRLNASDIIEIGGYKLLLITIDTIALDLDVNPDFISLEDNDVSSDFDYDRRDPASTRIRE